MKIQEYRAHSSGASQQIYGDRGLHRGFLRLVQAHSTPPNKDALVIAEDLESTAEEFLSLAAKLKATAAMENR